MEDPNRERKSGKIVGLVAGILVLLASLLLATSLCAAGPASGTAIPNIFKPESTPADSIYHLSVFVLAITGVIFAIVFSLIASAITKLRRRSKDGAEPPQVFGSNQIELA
jgi:cytochrome c oxidase subunit 2